MKGSLLFNAYCGKNIFHEAPMVKVILEILKRHEGLASILEIERLAGMAPEVHLILM